MVGTPQKTMWTLVVAAVGVAQSSSLDSGSGSDSGSDSGYPANTQHGECEGLESYWVPFRYEQQVFSYANAMCVPTAAGNLITYLAAKQNSAVAYPFNYEIDNEETYLDTSTGNSLTLLKYPIDTSSPVQKSSEYYLGGQIHTDTTMEKFDLRLLMNWQVNVGVTIPNARTGLQAYLDNTNRLGKARVVGVDRPQNVDDYNFVKNYQAPYMLHINITCLEDGDYNDPNTPVTLSSVTSSLLNFHGSTLGHTVVVYEQTGKSISQVGQTFELKGASGLYESRVHGDRGCDTTATYVTNFNTKCVDGLTYIELEKDDGLSTGAIVGIAVGAVVVVGGVGAVVYKKWPKGLIGGNMAYAQFI